GIGDKVPKNLSAVAEGNNTVLISWDSISGQQDDCQLWLRDPRNGSLPQQHTVIKGQVQHIFQGLIPGRNYTISLTKAYFLLDFISCRNVHRPIPIQNFKQYYEMKTASGNHAFFQEFEVREHSC
uniref:Fibronectin type-III domain-containing protein n=1 Tax=Apteryx owenii TaxID=8824 RepID=A0A8B9Q7J0_APTOW